MAARSRARLLATVALLATIVATILIVKHGVGSRRSTAGTTTQLTGGPVRRSHRPSSAKRTTTSTTSTTTSTTGSAGTYVVKPGDSLSVISARTGVPLPTLESLNPGVDPRALHAGQHLRLHR